MNRALLPLAFSHTSLSQLTIVPALDLTNDPNLDLSVDTRGRPLLPLLTPQPQTPWTPTLSLDESSRGPPVTPQHLSQGPVY